MMDKTSDEHVKDLLSAYHDKELGPDEGARVERHLTECLFCRNELAAIGKVSSLVRALPKNALPPGFRSRLAEKRLAGDELEKKGWREFSPSKLAAFAATSIAAGFIFFNDARSRLAPKVLPDLETTAALSEEQGRAALESFAKTAAAPRTPPSPEPDPGEPYGDAPSYTNDELRSYLDEESRRMGITGIVQPRGSSSDPLNGVPDRPLNPEEAKRYMRQMTQSLSLGNRDSRAKSNPTVLIGGGGTPQLLAQTSARGPLGLEHETAAKGSFLSSPAVIASAGSAPDSSRDPAEIFLEEGQSLEGLQGKKEYSEEDARALLRRQKRAAAKAAYGSAQSALNLPLLRSWSSDSEGLHSAGGAVLKSPGDFADFWTRVDRSDPLPPVDFDQEMVVAVFSGISSPPKRAEIVSAKKDSGRLIVRYRLVEDEKTGDPKSSYHAAVVERCDDPPVFRRIP